jgi:hypothetical protein
MTQINAFVGHSFTEDDAEVVRKFLEYFDQIKESGISFEWAHARAAEPRELATKVLSLIEGKNLFIGICTKKERGVAQQALQRAWIKRSILKGEEADFSWKTSDWIIQEIGLAIGRGMSLILLLERGLRPPGGLQGNIEYIEFDREVPGGSFGRILEMLSVLLPKAVTAKPSEVEPIGPTAESREPDEGRASDWLTPKPQWKRREYDFSLMHMIATDDAIGEKAISDAYLATAEGARQRNQEGWEARKEYLHLYFGKGGKLGRLEGLATATPKNDEVHRYLAKGYEVFKEFEKAAESYKRAAGFATEPDTRVRRLGDAAIAYLKSDKKSDAEQIVADLKNAETLHPEAKEVIVRSLRDIADLQGNKDSYFGLSEYLLGLHPDDTSVRFDLAYKYSQENQERLSLFHYLRISENERGTATWNNLGVQYEYFKLSSKSVKAYRIAETLGETLAMSNLAQKLINAGFLKEASDICDKALKTEDYHKNIGAAITRIKTQPEEEEKKEQELNEKSAPYSDFYRSYGYALTSAGISDCSGVWQGPKCSLYIEIRNGIFAAVGDYEQPNLGLGLALALQGRPDGGKSAPRKREVTYRGKVSGRTVKSVMQDRDINSVSTSASRTLLGGEQEIEVLMVISESDAEIRVYEKSSHEEGKFYVLTKLNSGVV